MSRPIHWPSVPAETPAAQPSPAAAITDATGLAAAFGPELTRLFGARCAARLVAEPGQSAAASCSHMAAQLRLPAPQSGLPSTTLTLLLAPTDIARLLDMLFGGSAANAGSALPALPPQSASWMALARFLADAAARAFAATGQRCQGPAQVPARPAPHPMPMLPQLLFKLDVDGVETLIGLHLEGAEAATAPPPTPDPELWRRRASARVLDLVLPVALRLSETQIPIHQVAALAPGDILPLDRPTSIELLAGGRRLKTLPASHFAPPIPNEEDHA